MFLLFSKLIFSSFPVTGSLKSKDSGLSPEPNYDKYPSESGEFLVSLIKILDIY